MTHLHIPVPAIIRGTLARTHELKIAVKKPDKIPYTFSRIGATSQISEFPWPDSFYYFTTFYFFLLYKTFPEIHVLAYLTLMSPSLIK